jgi:bacillolysin
MPKKLFVFLAVFVFVIFSIGASHVGGPMQKEDPGQVKPESGQRVMASDQRQLAHWNSFIEAELALGRLVGQPAELEPDGSAHQRLDQYYQGLPVLGGQIIRHYQGGTLSFVNGRYHQGIQVSIVPGLSRDKALEIARGSLSETDLSLRFDPALVIYPLESGYALAYKVLLGRRGKEMLSFIDAATGAILLQYDDTKYDATIGTGTGVHGDLKKVSTDSYSSTYRTWDKMRPAVVKTYDFLTDFYAWYYYDYTDTNLSKDSDNSWVGAKQAPVIDGHDYAAWTYDYYYIVHGRKSYNNANMLIKVMTNFDIWGISNAFYDGWDHSINFYDGDGVSYTYLTGALDIVAHEYTHGVTDYTSDLIYNSYSGALNEAFSDIMGTCVEFYYEAAGTGYQMADWFCAEDASKSWSTAYNNAFRRFDKPYLKLAWGWFEYPDHWTKRYTGSSDNHGVHINSSIANHWFYLLTVGGTNRISGITVTGIGRDKAERIAYKAWVSYLFPSADFWDARDACIQAAVDLYGSGTTEVLAVKTAWQAVGIF